MLGPVLDLPTDSHVWCMLIHLEMRRRQNCFAGGVPAPSVCPVGITTRVCFLRFNGMSCNRLLRACLSWLGWSNKQFQLHLLALCFLGCLCRYRSSSLNWQFLFALGRFVVQNVSAQKDGEKSKVKVKVRVNTHGIFTISTASMVEKVPTEEDDGSSVEADMECPNQKPAESSDVDVSGWSDCQFRSKIDFILSYGGRGGVGLNMF